MSTFLSCCVLDTIVCPHLCPVVCWTLLCVHICVLLCAAHNPPASHNPRCLLSLSVLTLNLVYSHNTVNMESAQYNIHCVRGGGGGDKSVTILCGGGSVRVWTQCAAAAMVRV